MRSLEERFWPKVAVGGPDECWLWLAGGNKRGYGQFWDGRRGRMVAAHRIAYELLVGEIPADRELDHLCRVKRCVNPAHLEPVPHMDNVRRGKAVGPRPPATHCRRGHPFTPENTKILRPGSRTCRICLRASWRRAHERKRHRPPP